MRMYDIIKKKRDGNALSESEIAFFVDGYTNGDIADYQAAAFCMAVYFQGMTEKETAALTKCMAESGDTIDLSCFGELSIDKHSTGGVGDKTSLIVAPVVASLGGKVAKISGRGLGHTGGTVDKIESVPGMKSMLSPEEFISQTKSVGIALIGQTGNLTPADKKLYAIRDVTATVDSIPLITSSIMSKKLAAGSKNIVLDVKVGSGAFMKTPEEASLLAENMVKIGKSCQRRVSAVLTNMDAPLGNAVGNSLEVIEAVQILRGEKKGDLFEVSMTLAAEMTALFKNITHDEARTLVEKAVSSKMAYEKMKQWIKAQGGDVRYIEETSLFEKASHVIPVYSPKDGFISSMDAEKIGNTAAILGAGRISKEDKIDHFAGIILNKKTGEKVKTGDVLAYLYTNDENCENEAVSLFSSAVTVENKKPEKKELIYRIIR